jgi:hypothetical protein
LKTPANVSIFLVPSDNLSISSVQFALPPATATHPASGSPPVTASPLETGTPFTTANPVATPLATVSPTSTFHHSDTLNVTVHYGFAVSEQGEASCSVRVSWGRESLVQVRSDGFDNRLTDKLLGSAGIRDSDSTTDSRIFDWSAYFVPSLVLGETQSLALSALSDGSQIIISELTLNSKCFDITGAGGSNLLLQSRFLIETPESGWATLKAKSLLVQSVLSWPFPDSTVLSLTIAIWASDLLANSGLLDASRKASTELNFYSEGVNSTELFGSATVFRESGHIVESHRLADGADSVTESSSALGLGLGLGSASASESRSVWGESNHRLGSTSNLNWSSLISLLPSTGSLERRTDDVPTVLVEKISSSEENNKQDDGILTLGIGLGVSLLLLLLIVCGIILFLIIRRRARTDAAEEDEFEIVPSVDPTQSWTGDDMLVSEDNILMSNSVASEVLDFEAKSVEMEEAG